MTPLVLVSALVVVTVSAAVQGLVGFGMNLLAVPVLVVLDPAFVPGPALVAGLATALLVAVRERSPLDRELGWAVVGLVPGTAVALGLLALVSKRLLTVLVGCAVLVAVALSLTRWRPAPTPGALLGAGVASGVLSTAASIGGPPMALLYAGASGERLRSRLSAFFVVAALLSLGGLAVTGGLSGADVRLSVLLLPAVAAGTLASGPLRPWVDRGRARPAVLALSALAAVVAIGRGLSG